MKIPQFVINPHDYSKENFAAGKESWISIDEVEPGSQLAQAVVRIEREIGSRNTSRQFFRRLPQVNAREAYQKI